MRLLTDFELVRVGLALAMFVSASYFDLRKRTVNDLLWVVFAAAAGLVYIFDFPTSLGEGITVIISISLAAGISYGIYRSGLFGGADMLALIVFAAILPTYNFGPTLQLGSQTSFHPFAPLIVLTNGVILSMIQLLGNLGRNALHRGSLFDGLQHEPASKKMLAMLIGHRAANPKYAFSIERIEGGKRSFDFGLKPAETAEYETGRDVWVTSATPFLVFIGAGFVMMLLTGDILAILMSQLL
jgi:archaeal preflagellin peptidase FlaK